MTARRLVVPVALMLAHAAGARTVTSGPLADAPTKAAQAYVDPVPSFSMGDHDFAGALVEATRSTYRSASGRGSSPSVFVVVLSFDPADERLTDALALGVGGRGDGPFTITGEQAIVSGVAVLPSVEVERKDDGGRVFVVVRFRSRAEVVTERVAW